MGTDNIGISFIYLLQCYIATIQLDFRELSQGQLLIVFLLMPEIQERKEQTNCLALLSDSHGW